MLRYRSLLLLVIIFFKELLVLLHGCSGVEFFGEITHFGWVVISHDLTDYSLKIINLLKIDYKNNDHIYLKQIHISGVLGFWGDRKSVV